MRIGILQAGHAPDSLQPQHGDFPDMFARLLDGHGFEFASYDVENMVFPASPTECDGWLISGSKHGAYEDHPFIPPLETFIRDCVAADRPIVGICFGHQIIAQALGGQVEKFSGGWGLGKTRYDTTAGPLSLNAWHQDQVTRLPEGAEVLGGNDHCANAILAYGRRAWTIQPHPEFPDPLISAFVSERRGTGTYPDALMERAAEAAAQAEGTDAPRVAAAIASFLKERTAYGVL